MLQRDRVGTLRFAPRNGRTAAALGQRHPELIGVDSMVWVQQQAGRELVLLRSDAAFAAARYLGGPWRILAMIGGLVPRAVRDPVYDLVARNRHRFGGAAICAMVATDVRERALP